MRRGKAGIIVILLALLAPACGGEDKSDVTLESLAETKPADSSLTAESEPPESARLPEKTVGRVRVVDIEGRALPGMLPIVTTEPNAFNEPVETGPPTDGQGRGAVVIPKGRAFYVRAWDPQLRLFANNFFTVQPDAGPETNVMEVVMVPAASLTAVFLQPDGSPAGETGVKLMLVHPTQGPWWPAQTVTDEAGSAVFANLPPGQFEIRFNTPNSAAQLASHLLPPGETSDAGIIPLQ